MKTALFVSLLVAASLAGAQTPAPTETVLLENGPVRVTSEDFEAFLLRAPEQYRPEIRASAERIGKAMETVYTNRILAEEARKIGLDKDPRVTLRAKQIVEGYLAQLWMDHYAMKLDIPDMTARAEEVYKLDKARFTEPERVNITHIVISLEGRTRDMARARAEEVAAKARAGENLPALAKMYTDERAFAKTGGRIEQAEVRSLEKPIAEALAPLSPGAIAGPIETESGFHLVRLDSRTPSRLRPFAEVKDGLVAAEKEKFANLSTDRRVGELKKEPALRIHEDKLRALIVDVDQEAIRRLHQQPPPSSQPTR